MTLSIVILALFAAILPVFLWFFIFYRKSRAGFVSRFLIAFFFAALGGVAFWQNENFFFDFFAAHGVGIFVGFFALGAAIEYFKNFVVRIAGIRYFQNIDDVMDLSFAAALGFTFGENFFHFLVAFSGNNPEVVGPLKLGKFILMRELYFLPIHLVTSGLFGYFYGVGIFAGDRLREKEKGRFFFRLFQKIFFWISEKKVFRAFKIFEGTFFSAVFYALFFGIAAKNPTIGDFLAAVGFSRWAIDENLLPVISFVFFQVGTVALFSLLDKKRRWRHQNLLRESEI